MFINQIGNNVTEVNVGGVCILFSYNTPVACFVSTANKAIPTGWYKTNKKWSKTTSKHINQWYSGLYTEKDQYFFDNIISGI